MSLALLCDSKYNEYFFSYLQNGNTPLITASINGSLEIVKHLLNKSDLAAKSNVRRSTCELRAVDSYMQNYMYKNYALVLSKLSTTTRPSVRTLYACSYALQVTSD